MLLLASTAAHSIRIKVSNVDFSRHKCTVVHSKWLKVFEAKAVNLNTNNTQYMGNPTYHFTGLTRVVRINTGSTHLKTPDFKFVARSLLRTNISLLIFILNFACSSRPNNINVNV